MELTSQVMIRSINYFGVFNVEINVGQKSQTNNIIIKNAIVSDSICGFSVAQPNRYTSEQFVLFMERRYSSTNSTPLNGPQTFQVNARFPKRDTIGILTLSECD